MEIKKKTLEIIFNLATEQVINRTKEVILENGVEIGTTEVGQQVELRIPDDLANLHTKMITTSPMAATTYKTMSAAAAALVSSGCTGGSRARCRRSMSGSDSGVRGSS